MPVNRDEKQDRYKPLTQPTQRRFAPNNEKAFVPEVGQTWRDMAQSDNPIVAGAGSLLDTFSRTTEQLQKNMISGALQIPGDIAGTFDIARIGIPAAVTAIPDDPAREDDNYLTRLSEAFMNGAISPEGQEELAADMENVIADVRAQVPDVTDEELEVILNDYQDSDEFFQKMSDRMSPGLRFAQYANWWANDLVGLGKRPDEQTFVDDVQQIVGGSFIGLPKVAQEAIGGFLRKRVGDKFAGSLAGRIGGRALEAATPVTMPLTPGNVALNAGVGTGINEAIRVMTGQPSLTQGGIPEFTEPEQYTPEEIEETPELAQFTDREEGELLPLPVIDIADGHGFKLGEQIDQQVAAGGITLGAMFGLPAFRRQMAQNAANKAQAAADFTNAGPTLAEQSSRLDPMLAPTAGFADSQAPIRRGANQFELNSQAQQYVSKGEMIDAMDAHLSTASPPNVHDAVSNVVNFGTLANHDDTIPLHTIRRAASTLSPEQRQRLTNYALAKQRQQDVQIQRATLRQEMSAASMEMQAAKARGDKRAFNNASKKHADLRQKWMNSAADAPDSRPSLVMRTKQEVDDAIRVGEADPTVMAVADMQRRSGHDMLNYMVKNGYITSQEATTMAMHRDFYFPMRERSHPNVNNPVARKALLFVDRLRGRHKEDTDHYTVDAVRNLDERTSGKVNKPKDPIVALHEAWADVVRSVTANNARRQVVDTLRMFDGAEGTMFRQFTFNNRKSFSPEEFYNPNNKLRETVENHDTPLTRVIRDGRFEFYEFSDPSMTRALEFAPLATVPIFNSTRKFWQSFTTGVLAPWFAPKAAIWDVNVARTTMKQGRSLGLIDTYARRLFNESALANTLLDHVPDPTAYLSVAARIPMAMSARAARALGNKIADDLALHSGFFNLVAQVPGGRKYVADMGTNMAKMFDRSVFNVYNRNLSTHMGLLQDNTRILDDYTSISPRITPLGEGAKNIWHGYRALIESVQGATRYAFFAENYSRLKAKHGGTVPKGELAKLVKETRDLTGDLSKYSGNKFIQGATSVIPYGNPVIQGTRHILGAAIPPSGAKAINFLTGGKANLVEERTNRFWSQFIGGVLLPAIGGYSILHGWEGAEDYWENKTPEWRQQTGIPLPNAESLAHYLETGEWPEFSPDKLSVLEIPPELSLFLNPVIGGLRSLGIMTNPRYSVPHDLGDELRAAFENVISFANPPLVDLYGAITGTNIDLSAGQIEPTRTDTFGGANADMLTFRSDVSQQLYDIIGALASTSGQIVAQTFDVFDMAQDEGFEFGEAADAAFDTFKYEVVRRFPDMPMVWDVHNKQYAFTPESQYVYETQRTLEPLIGSVAGSRQQSVETDSKDRAEAMVAQGLIPPAKISDPMLKDLSQIVYDTLRKKGPFKQAADAYTDLRANLTALEASRTRWPAEAYHAKYNEIVQQQQLLKQIQAQELTQLEETLKTQVGPTFEAAYGVPFSYGSLVDLIRKNVGSQ